MMDCMLQLVKSPRPYYSVLTCAVTSKTNLNSMKVSHYSKKKYWPLNIQSEAQREGKGERRREEEGGDQGESAKGKREESLLSPIPLPFSLPPNSTLFPRYT